MSDRLRYLCDKDLRTHTDADLDDDVSELQTLALRLVQDIRNRDQRISELEQQNEKQFDRFDLVETENSELRAKLEQAEVMLEKIATLKLFSSAMSPLVISQLNEIFGDWLPPIKEQEDE